MNNINNDGITFRNTLFPVQQIRKSDSWVFLDQFGLILFEPGIAVVAGIEFLFIRKSNILQHHSDSLSETPDAPVAKSEFVVHIFWF